MARKSTLKKCLTQKRTLGKQIIAYCIGLIISNGVVQTAHANTNKSVDVALADTAPHLHPLQGSNQQNSVHDSYNWQRHLIHTPLAAQTQDGDWHCLLCQTFPSLENKLVEQLPKSEKHAIRVRFQIHQDARWADGSPVSEKDLYFSWTVTRQVLKETNPQHFFVLAQSAKIAEPASRAVDFYFDQKQYLGVSFKDIFLISEKNERHIWQNYSSSTELYFKNSHYTKQQTEPALYSGSFFPTRTSTHGRSYIANFSYFLGQPHLETIHTIKPSKCEGSCIRPLGTLRTIIKENSNKHYQWNDTFWVEALWLNLRDPALADLDVRRAIRASINQNELVTQVMNNQAFPAFDWIHAGSNYFNLESIQTGLFNLKLARQSLEKAGWKNHLKEGQRIKNDRTLSTDLWVDSSSQRPQIASYIQSSLAKVGIRTLVNKIESHHEFIKKIREMRLTGSYLAAFYLNPDEDLTPLFSTEAIPKQRNRYKGQNITALSNPKIDRLLNNLKLDWKKASRKENLQKLTKTIHSKAAFVPLFHYFDVTEFSKDLKLDCPIRWHSPVSLCAANWSRKDLTSKT